MYHIKYNNNRRAQKIPRYIWMKCISYVLVSLLLSNGNNKKMWTGGTIREQKSTIDPDIRIVRGIFSSEEVPLVTGGVDGHISCDCGQNKAVRTRVSNPRALFHIKRYIYMFLWCVCFPRTTHILRA